MKLVPLFIANIKNFARNWKSVLLLLGTPLIIITIIFLSLSQAKVSRVDIGITANVDLPAEYLEQFNVSFDTHIFDTKENCILSIYKYKNYACIQIISDQEIRTTIYYDNTREPISWEILQMLKIGIDILKTKQSLKTINGFISQAQGAAGGLTTVASDLSFTRKNIENYENDLNRAIVNLQSTSTNLQTTLDRMESDLKDARYKQNAAQQTSDSQFSTAMQGISSARSYVYSIPEQQDNSFYREKALENINGAQSSLQSTQSQINYQLDSVDNQISFYEQQRQTGEGHVQTINNYITDLQLKKKDLATYRAKIVDYERRLAEVKAQLESTDDMDAGAIVSPIKISDQPTYIPSINPSSSTAKRLAAENISEETRLAQAASFLNLQILYPKLYFLIVFFLSLLVSTFICLRDIHSPSTIRVRLVRHVFFPQVLSTFLSSICISFIPIIVVLIAGEYLFFLPIHNHLWLVLAITALTSASFTLLGMFISHLIKNESITLLLSTFTLILVIFFSGFLYPIERMQLSFANVAEILPLRIAVQDFYQIVYYNNTNVGPDLYTLGLWILCLFLLLCFVKYVRKT